MCSYMGESEEELKSFLMKVKERSEKAGLKHNTQKTKIRASVPLLHGKETGKKNGNSGRPYFLGLQNHHSC